MRIIQLQWLPLLRCAIQRPSSRRRRPPSRKEEISRPSLSWGLLRPPPSLSTWVETLSILRQYGLIMIIILRPQDWVGQYFVRVIDLFHALLCGHVSSESWKCVSRLLPRIPVGRPREKVELRLECGGRTMKLRSPSWFSQCAGWSQYLAFVIERRTFQQRILYSFSQRNNLLCRIIARMSSTKFRQASSHHRGGVPDRRLSKCRQSRLRVCRMDGYLASFTSYKDTACGIAKQRCRTVVVRDPWSNLGLAITLVHDKEAKAVEMHRSFDR